MHLIIFITTLLLAITPITALTEAEDRSKGDCALGVLNLDAKGQVTGCGTPLVPIGKFSLSLCLRLSFGNKIELESLMCILDIGSRGEYKGLGGKL